MAMHYSFPGRPKLDIDFTDDMDGITLRSFVEDKLGQEFDDDLTYTRGGESIDASAQLYNGDNVIAARAVKGGN
jgi:hypothetical protein